MHGGAGLLGRLWLLWVCVQHRRCVVDLNGSLCRGSRYYRTAAGVVVVFDVTSSASFEGAKTWVRDVQARGTAACVTVLVGNKVDLHEQRTVSEEAALSYAQGAGIEYFEVSSKHGYNVTEVFDSLARAMVEVEAGARTGLLRTFRSHRHMDASCVL